METYIRNGLTLCSVKEYFLSAEKHLFMAAINCHPRLLTKKGQKSAPGRTIRGTNLHSSPKLKVARKELGLSHSSFSVLWR